MRALDTVSQATRGLLARTAMRLFVAPMTAFSSIRLNGFKRQMHGTLCDRGCYRARMKTAELDVNITTGCNITSGCHLCAFIGAGAQVFHAAFKWRRPFWPVIRARK
jgi:hypothetical protein